MKVTIRKPDIDTDNISIVMRNIVKDDLVIPGEAIMAIDGSTTNTGIAILRKSDGALYYSLSFAREDDESPVRYKVRLKRFVNDILSMSALIDIIYYEEPFIGHISAVKNLMMLRTFVEELIIENEPRYDYIKHFEINNMRWKKLFLAPDKCPQGTDAQKKAIRAKLESYMPYLNVVTQDEIDAISLGFIACIKIKDGKEEELEQKKKVTPFNYNIRFIGADSDDGLWTEFGDIQDIPLAVLENGIYYRDIPPTANFDKYIYQSMGNEDKVVILKFSSDKHGNIILKHRIGHLAANYDYIYAVIWRKSRKKV